MTDAERQTCERIALAMGYYVFSVGPGHSLPGSTEIMKSGTRLAQLPGEDVREPPNFYTDPFAATSLWEWLFDKGFDVLISPERTVANPATWWEAEVCLAGPVPMVPGVMGVGPNWMVALADAMVERVFEAARAADAAIQEASGGK